MEIIISTIVVIAAVWFIADRINKREESRKSENQSNQTSADSEETQKPVDSEQNTNEPKEPDTRGLMFKVLSNIGCQPKKNDDGSLEVQYQGESFHMDFGGMYAQVWDPMWAGIKADDPDLSNVREAVNAANFNFGPTVVMTAPNEDGMIGFHSRRDIMLHPACPDNEIFVKAVLDSFFSAKELVRSSFQQINAHQMEAQKSRRPVGFTINN